MGWLAAIKAFFGFGEAVAREVTQRDGELNTPDMQANAEAAQIQKDRDQAAADILNPDQKKAQEDIAP